MQLTYRVAAQSIYAFFFVACMALTGVLKKFPSLGNQLTLFLERPSALLKTALLSWLILLVAIPFSIFITSRIYEWKEWDELVED